MSRGVVYMLTGLKHANHLVVSLYSLRDWWSGPVALIAGCANSAALCEKCAADERLGDVTVVRWSAPTRRSTGGSGQQYLNKCEMGRLSPFDASVFLDADTLVVGDIGAVFPVSEEIRLTCFADWFTTGGLMKSRIEKWRENMPREVARALGCSYPAINTGVLGFSVGQTRWFARWREVAAMRCDFICDEIAAQLIFPDFPHVVLDERWNCSPVYSWVRHGPDGRGTGASGYRPDPRIWHGHGKKFVKKETGRSLWIPRWAECVREDIASISEWTDAVPWAPRKYLAKEGIHVAV